MSAGTDAAAKAQTADDATHLLLTARTAIISGQGLVTVDSPNWGMGGESVRQQASELLDGTLAYVEGLLATVGSHTPVTADDQRMIATALDQTASDLQLIQSVDTALYSTFVGDLASFTSAAGDTVKGGLRKLGDWTAGLLGALPSAFPTWLKWAILGIGVVILAALFLRLRGK